MVAPYHLYPVQHGGAVRMYNVVRELARRGHEVSVVGFVESEEQREAGRHLREFCREVDLLVRVPAPNRWRGLVPADVAEFDLPDFRSALVAHLERCDPDILQVEYTHMAPYGRLAGGRVACLTEHDVSFVSRYRHTLAEGDRRARWSRYRNYLETFHFELNALRAFDVVFAVTSRDAQLLRTYLDGAIHVSDRVPIGANVHAMGSAQRNPDPRRLVFVGNFAHSPNVDAVTFFAREIMPDLLRQEPDLRIVIAGPNPPPAIQRLGSDPRVEVTGFVPDLAPIYATACAFISPIRIAAGVRVKLLEAFAARVPVVTTSAGAEGIDLAHEREALIADTPAEFVNQTLRLVRDPALGERLASSARRLVEERYSWTSIVDALEDEYRAAMRRKEARGGIV